MWSDDMIKRIEIILKEGYEQRSRMIDEFKKLPKGELIIKKNGNRTYFYRKYGNKEASIGADEELRQKLVRKCILKNEIASCENNCRIMEKSLDSIKKTKSTSKKRLHKLTYQRIHRLFPPDYYAFSDKQRQWIGAISSNNRFNENNLKYATDCGIKVRSKSEKIIADMLTRKHIAFRYEVEFITENHSFFPDFTIIKDDGKVVLWEHLGLIDDPEYFIRACEKVESYRREGFCQHTNLICTYEEDIATEGRLDKIIERYLL